MQPIYTHRIMFIYIFYTQTLRKRGKSRNTDCRLATKRTLTTQRPVCRLNPSCTFVPYRLLRPLSKTLLRYRGIRTPAKGAMPHCSNLNCVRFPSFNPWQTDPRALSFTFFDHAAHRRHQIMPGWLCKDAMSCDAWGFWLGRIGKTFLGMLTSEVSN